MNWNTIPEDIKKDLETAKEILINAGCKEIYIFGSLINGTFDKDSDIDIATVGLSKDKFFSVYGELLERLSRDVDLIGLDYENDFSKMLKETTTLERVA